MAERFTPGSTIVARDVQDGLPWLEITVEVVADDDVLALLVEPGAPFRFFDHPRGPHPWGQLTAWGGSTALMLHRDGEHYSVWKFFVDGEFDSWYVNFEQPLVRGPHGIDVDDHQLDLVITPDGSRTWKDVQDLAPSLASGRMDVDQVLAALAAATEVTGLLDRDERWWASYDDWTPPA